MQRKSVKKNSFSDNKHVLIKYNFLVHFIIKQLMDLDFSNSLTYRQRIL